jgi:hypothetical protein
MLPLFSNGSWSTTSQRDPDVDHDPISPPVGVSTTQAGQEVPQRASCFDVSIQEQDMQSTQDLTLTRKTEASQKLGAVKVHHESEIQMECADENFAVRTFMLAEVREDGQKDYTCTHCGWLQASAAAGAAELCRLATWHDEAEYRRYADVARSGGFDIPASR